MEVLKNTTQKAQGIISDYRRTAAQTIFDAYTRPSSAKIHAYYDIEKRAKETPGYNNDLKVVGACSHFFSTVYSITENGKTFIIKDTRANTYKVAL